MRSLAEISITPNRGDAMSVLGLARELAAASGMRAANRRRRPAMPPARAAHTRSFSGAARARRRAARALPVA